MSAGQPPVQPAVQPPVHPEPDVVSSALPEVALLAADDLRQLPAPALTPADCPCARCVCPGWESVAAPLAPPLVRRLGTLRVAGDDEPTVEEWPGRVAAGDAAGAAKLVAGGYWSPVAPVAPAFFPYNRCAVWACVHCGRGFLQYTEFGGYYVDHRLRQIDPALVV